MLSNSVKRIAIPSEEKNRRTVTAKIIGENDLASSGKKNPASARNSGIPLEEDEDKKRKKKKEVDGDVNKNIFVPIIKSNEQERTITGIVLQPEVVDAQGDIMDKDVIRKAAHQFLSKYNKATELGLMHKYFGDTGFELYESWIAPQDVVIKDALVKEGSWLMTVYVGKDKIWKMVNDGKLKGFSIGGKAKAKSISNEKEGLNG
jgi:hypothetical protein